MRVVWTIVLWLGTVAGAVLGQDNGPSARTAPLPVEVLGLPLSAKILELRTIPETAHPKRALILWMLKPQKFPRHGSEPQAGEEAEPYTCPEDTRGWFFRGRTRVSLVDTSSRKVLNTVQVKIPLVGGWQDSFDIPYWIQPKYYRVDPPLRAGEGKPVIMDLKDYNGDGKPLEFGVFNAESCSVVTTQLIGYSDRQDRVIQYAIQLKGEWYDGRDPQLLWLDRFLLQKPIRPGIWKYTRQYNSGAIATFQIAYDPATESFHGSVEWENSR